MNRLQLLLCCATLASACNDDNVAPGPGPSSASQTDAAFTFQHVGLRVAFTDRSTAVGAVRSWLWDFGDGVTSREQSPTHTYDADGVYKATLTITDGTGTVNTEPARVTIAAPQPYPPACASGPLGADLPTTDPGLGDPPSPYGWGDEVRTRFPASVAQTWAQLTAGTTNLAGTVVEVTSTVVIDSAAEIVVGGIHVHGGGVLVVGDNDATIRTPYILVEDGGRFEAGSAMHGYARKLILELTGDDTGAEVMGSAALGFEPMIDAHHHGNPSDPPMGLGFGKKVLAIGNGGTLELHGAKGSPSWTRIEGTLDPDGLPQTSKDTFAVKGRVDWQAGDTLVLGTTDYEPLHSETVRIKQPVFDAEAGLSTITLEAAVTFPHYGEKDRYSGVDLRAAVALLSRNILVKSDAGAEASGFGGQTQFRYGSKVHVDGVEFERLGQPGKAGRYPVHFHLTADAKGSYVRRSAVHDSLQRGIVLHGVRNAVLQDNVMYNGFGHGVFLEDGTEAFNHLDHNLVVVPRPVIYEKHWNPRSYKPINDTESCNASGFWISNNHNRITNNMAVGVPLAGRGFWLVSTNPKIYDGHSVNVAGVGNGSFSNGSTAPILEFSNNTAVASFFGLDTAQPGFRKDECRNGLAPGAAVSVPEADRLVFSFEDDAQPGNAGRVAGSHGASDPKHDGTDGGRQVVNVIDRFHAIRSRSWGIWARDKWFWVKNSSAVDCAESGMTLVSAGDESGTHHGYWATITDSTIVGFSSNTYTPRGAPEDNPVNLKTLNWLNGGKATKERRGLNFYDGPASVHDTCFHRFGRYDEMVPSGAADFGDIYQNHAAIGWFGPGNNFQFSALQETGGLWFHDVSVRHWVYQFGPTLPNQAPNLKDGDKQTFILDTDGTLQGIPGSASINNYPIHRGPVWERECGSRESCFASPYAYGNVGILYKGQFGFPDPANHDAYRILGPNMCIARTYEESWEAKTSKSDAFCLQGFGTTGDPKRAEIPLIFQQHYLALLGETYTAQFFALKNLDTSDNEVDLSKPIAPPVDLHVRLANAVEDGETTSSLCYPTAVKAADLDIFVSGQEIHAGHALLALWKDETDVSDKTRVTKVTLEDDEEQRVVAPSWNKRPSPGYVRLKLSKGNLVVTLHQDQARSADCFPTGFCEADGQGSCKLKSGVEAFTSMCEHADCDQICKRFGNRFNVCPEGGCLTVRVQCKGASCSDASSLSPACTKAGWPSDRAALDARACAVRIQRASFEDPSCAGSCNGDEQISTDPTTGQCTPPPAWCPAG